MAHYGKKSKPTLAKEMQKNVTPAESIPRNFACLTDGMSLIQRIHGNQKTFAEVASHALALVIAEGSSCAYIDVVFDTYRN